ncbi:helix-turn-helix domain-containing protein [soil metagenome]
MDPAQVKRLDPRSLKGLAHPLRMELLGLLRTEGPSTATQLARRAGESSGATSYHLRQLAFHGFVEEVPERGNGRDRWWRAAHQSTAFDVAEFADDPDTRGALEIFLYEAIRAHFRRAATWLSEMHSWDRRWVKASTSSDYGLRLDPERARALVAELDGVIEGYREQHEGATDAERVAVVLHVFPERRREPENEDPA